MSRHSGQNLDESYREGEKGDIRVSMVDIVYHGYCSFSGPVYRQSSFNVVAQLMVGPYALPFFEFIRSEISRLRARLGSKFCGSTAFSKRQLDNLHEKLYIIDSSYGYIAEGESLLAPPRLQSDLESHTAPRRPP